MAAELPVCMIGPMMKGNMAKIRGKCHPHQNMKTVRTAPLRRGLPCDTQSPLIFQRAFSFHVTFSRTGHKILKADRRKGLAQSIPKNIVQLSIPSV